MDNQNQNTNVNSVIDDGGQPTSSSFGVVVEPGADPEALSADPTAMMPASDDTGVMASKPHRALHLFKRANVVVVLLLVAAMVLLLVVTVLRHSNKSPQSSTASVASEYSTQQIPLSGFTLTAQGVNFAPSDVIINGSLRANDGFIIAPSVQPNAPTAGQLYFDQNTHQLAYFNGSGFIALTQQNAVVQNIGGISGAITLGGGLSVVGNQLTASFPGGVPSVGGVTGAVTVGSGLKMVGSDLQNNGVLSLTAATPNLVITDDGAGNLSISNVGGGSGTVTSTGGTAGRIAKFTGVQNVEDSLLSESGSTVTVNGSLSVTGTTTLASALTVGNGGTGATTLPLNGVLVGNGTSAVTGVTASGGGQCLISTGGGAPTFQACPGGGVISINGLSGALTIANATGSVNTITIDDASTTTKGIASFNSTNFTVTGGAVNTAQNISTGSTPTFAGVNTNTITPSAAMSIGAAGQALSLLGNASSLFSVSGGGQTTNVGFNGAPTGTVNYNFDRSAAAGTYSICTSVGNCAISGAAGGDLTGTYPNPTIAKLQGTNLTIAGPSGGHILVYNATNTRWENHAVSGDVTISETGASTIQADAVALGTDTTGNYVVGLTAGNGVSVTGTPAEGWSPTVAVLYGSSANTAVQGNTGITVTAGSNLTGGGSITLGAGGSVTLNVASSPVFSGTLTVQGATATIGTTSQLGSLVLNDGSSNTGTLRTAALGQDTIYTFPDAGAGTATVCLTSGNCASSGGGVTTIGGTTDRLSKFTSSQAIGNSSVSDNGTTVTVTGTANLVVQGGTSTLGTTSQGGSLVLSDGSSNTVTIVTSALAADRIYTLPDVGGDATLCVNSGNCIGGTGSAPNGAAYLVATLDGTLTNERSLAAGSNVSLTDGGANGTMTIATVQNPTFTTSVTTPILQSSGALTISSAAGQTVAIDAGTTIELQDSTNVTGSLDVSAAFTAGTANAFQVNSSGAITAATGIASSGTITFSGLNCTTFANGGALTTNGSGQLVCSDDDGGAGGAVSGSGTSGTLPVFNGTNTITDSIVTQTGTSGITIAGDLTLNTALTVANGGTGAASFTARGVLYGNGTSAVQVTAAGTSGQVLIANGSGVPTFATFSGDVAVSNTGVTTIQADSVALGTDTTGSYVSAIGTLTGLTTTGNTGEGSTPTLSVSYGSIANTAVQGNVTLTCPSGAGNLTGGGNSVTLGAGGSCNNINIVNNPTFSTSVTTPSLILTGAGSNGTIQVGTLGQGTVYTLPDPGGASATICLSTGNCAAAGAAGGDLTGTYPNPTIAKLQGTNLTIASPSGGHILVYNATNTRWENQAVSGDIAISETGTATIQANSVALGTDTTGNYVLGLTAGNGINVTGSAGEGWSPTVAVVYGSAANTAVQGNTSITVSAGTNLTGGGSITLGSGGTVTLNVASSPTFSGTLTVQGASATVGTTSQQGSVVLHDGTGQTGTLHASTGTGSTTYNLTNPGGTVDICLSTGNCAGSGGGVTGSGTNDRVAKFTSTGSTIGNSSISDNGSVVTINGTANFVIQGGTGTFGTTSQAGTVAISDGSSNKVSIVTAALTADRIYSLPDAGSDADFCLSSGNCVGGSGGGAPNNAAYLVAALNGTLTSERALAGGTNISLTDGGANGNMTVATVNNPTFSTSVTTPALQSSGALTISSAAGQTVAIDAGTTIELQDSTNVTGSLDVSVALNVGTANAFQVSSGGAISAATGITSSGTITFSGLNCTSFANGGAITANASGQLSCTDDDGGAGGAITGSGTSGTIPLFNGTNSITNSIITQSGTSVTLAGDLTLNTALTVANGGTGATSLTTRGVLYGNGTSAVQVTAAGTSGQVLVANGSGVPTFATFSGDVTVSSTGVTTIQADSVALGTDTTGNYVATLGTLTGLTTTGNTGEGSTPTLSVTYGSGANTAVQGNTTLTCPSGTGNLTGGGTSITLGTGGTCANLNTVNNPTFSTSVTTPSLILTGAGSNGTLQVANLGQATTFTLPDPGAGSASICLSTGNCSGTGSSNTLQAAYDAGNTITTTNNRSITIAMADTATDPNFTIDLQCDTSCGSNGRFAIQDDGTDVFSVAPAGGAVTLQNTSNSPSAFNIKNASPTSGNVFTVDTSANRVGINLGGSNTPTLATGVAGMEVNGAIRLSGTSSAADDFATASSGNVGARINIGFYNYAGAAQGIAVGVGSSSDVTSHGIAVFDARTSPHQASMGVFSVDEQKIFGLSWEGLSATGYLKTSGASNIAISPNATDAATFSTTAVNLLQDTTVATGKVLTVNTITPNSALTVGDVTQQFTLQGTSTSVITAKSGSNVTTVDFTTPTASTTLHFPALGTGTYTICTSSGNCAGVGATLQTAYNNSTSTEMVLNGTNGGLTVRDNSTPIGGNLLEVQNNAGSTTYFGVTTAGISVTGTSTSSGNVNTTGGAIQTNSTDRISNGGNLVNIGTITTSGAINSQTISSAANFTGTLTVQGSNALTLGTASSNTGAIVFKGSGGAGTLTLAGPTTPNASNYTLTIPAITNNANICTDNSVCTGYAPSTGGTGYIQNQNASAQTTANFWVSGTGRADGSFLAPTFDVASAGALAIGNTTATSINIGKTGSNILTTVNGQTLLKPVTNSTIAVRAQDANGTAVINVDTTSSNLITNSTFETGGVTGWTGHGGAAAPTQSILAHYDNDGSLQVVTTNTGHGAQYNFALAASTQYSFSVFAKATGSSFSTFQIGYSSDGSTDTSCATAQTVSTTQWLRITCTFTTTTVSGTRYVYAKQTDATGRTFYLDAVQLETAAAPTPYRNAKLSLGNSVLINGGPLDAAASTAALQVNALSQGKGLVVYGSGENSVFTTVLDVRSADDTTSFFHVNETSRETDVLGGNSFLGTPALNVAPVEAAATALRVSGIASATAPVTVLKAGATPGAGATLLSLQDSGGLVHGAFNNIGNQLTLGRIAGSGTVSQGQLVLADGTTDNFGLTLQTGVLGGNRTITLPDPGGATATICYQTSSSCGFTTNPGSGFYLQQVPTSNSAGASGANVIAPTAASIVGLAVNATTSTSAVAATFTQTNNTSPADTVQINSTNTGGTQTNGLLFNRNGSSGTTQNGINITNTAGTLTNGLAFTGTIGTDIQRGSGTLTVQGAGGVSVTSSGGSVNIGSTGSSTAGSTTHIGDTSDATGTQAITVGSTANTANSTTVQGGSLTFQTSSASSGALFRTTTNSSAALQVQNSSSDTLFNMTTNAKTNLLSNPGFETNTTSPWATVNGGTIVLSRITSQSYAQAASMQVAISTATQWAGAKYPITLTDSTSYTLSFYVKSSSGATSIDAGYSPTGAFAGEDDCVTNVPAISTAGWTRFSCTFTTAASHSGTPYIYIEIPTATISTFWVDNVQLTQSSTDNGAYYAGQIDFSGSAINGQLAVQPTNDSTSVFQVFSSAGVPVFQVDTVNKQAMTSRFLVTNNFTDPTKSFRIRTDGSGIDLEAAGGAGPGGIWLSGWSGTKFGSGTQYTFMRTDPTLNAPQVVLGAGLGTGTPTLAVMDTKNTTGDPSYNSNGAIYYNSTTNRFRCYENSLWKNCTGTADIVERRWGYIAVSNTSAVTVGYSGFITSGQLTSSGGAGNAQAESYYASYTPSASTNSHGGWGDDGGGTLPKNITQTRWLPRFSTRIRVDASAVTSSRYWVGLSEDPMNATNPTTGTVAEGTEFIALAASSSVSSGAWICGSSNGTNQTGTSTGVTMTANHYYDIILEMTSTSTLVCSISDNGGAFVSVTQTNTLPTSTVSLGIIGHVTTLTNAARSISIAYVYISSN